MPPEEAAVEKSPLDKPLSELTEDDISQLTREDCRTYLKRKGMRRPSWNKSQAIQQVISLKMLLEPTPDTDRRRLYIPRPQLDTVKNDASLNNPSKATSVDEDISESAEEMLSGPGKDAEKPDVSSGHKPVEDNGSSPPRNTGSSSVPAGQMTIFYCGRVHVFDDISFDKAQALLHYAASPHAFPQEVIRSPATQSTSHLQDTSTKSCQENAISIVPNVQSVRMTETTRVHGEEHKSPDDNPAEGPSSRKASVQRYLEKRKDRFKSKKKVGSTTTTPGLDVYVPHHMGHHISNEHSSRSDPCSPQQLRPPQMPIRCSSLEDSSARDASLNPATKVRDLNR